MLDEILDGIAAMQQDASVAINEGNPGPQLPVAVKPGSKVKYPALAYRLRTSITEGPAVRPGSAAWCAARSGCR